MAAACAASLTVKDLAGSWKLVEVQSRPVRPGSPDAVPGFTIRDQSIEGFDGCNRFWGRLDQPGGIASTRRGCPEGALRLPLDLSDPAAHLATGRLDQGRLILPATRGLPESVFERTR